MIYPNIFKKIIKNIRKDEGFIQRPEILIENEIINYVTYHPILYDSRGMYHKIEDKIYVRKEMLNEYWRGYIAFHELAHWTGHRNRLNRPTFRNVIKKRNAIKQDIIEELVADFSAIILCHKSKCLNECIAYLQWETTYKRALKHELPKRIIYQSYIKSKQVVNYIINYFNMKVDEQR